MCHETRKSKNRPAQQVEGKKEFVSSEIYNPYRSIVKEMLNIISVIKW